MQVAKCTGAAPGFQAQLIENETLQVSKGGLSSHGYLNCGSLVMLHLPTPAPEPLLI